MSNAVEDERKVRKRGKWLCRAGWATFGLSLALPALNVQVMSNGPNWISGWGCLLITYQIAWAAITGAGGWLVDGGGIYYTGLALANTLLFLSPIANRILRGDLRRLRRLSIVETAASLTVGSYIAMSLPQISVLGPAVYAWLASFVLLTAGTFQLSKRRLPGANNQPTAPHVHTAEEMAALRELEDYLHSIDRAPQTGGHDEQESIQAGVTSRRAQTRRPPVHTRPAPA